MTFTYSAQSWDHINPKLPKLAKIAAALNVVPQAIKSQAVVYRNLV